MNLTIINYRNTYSNKVFSIVNIIALCGIEMGICYSRAIVTFSMLLMAANVVVAVPLKTALKNWIKAPFSICAIAYFSFYLLSEFWSENTSLWSKVVFGNIPFLLYPFSFCNLKNISPRQFWVLMGGLVLVSLPIIIKSIVLFFTYKSAYLQGYNYSKVIPTNFNNDHIRFSLVAFMNIAFMVYGLDKVPIPNRFNKRLIIAITVSFLLLYIYFIHLLSVKTGLICFYTFLLIFILFKIRRWYFKIVILVGLGILVIGVYQNIPTLRTKVTYLRSEYFDFHETKHLDYHYSDAGRLISYKLALPIIQKNWLLGIGAGDVETEMDKAYSIHYPNIPTENRLIPHNQFMVTFMSIGVIMGMALCGFFIAYFVEGIRRKDYFLYVSIFTFFICFMVEPWLTTQFGIATYLLYSLVFGWLAKVMSNNCHS